MENEYKDFTYYIEIKECPICLDPIDTSSNEILTLDCCNKEIHLECLKNWIKNPQNLQKNKCILCRVSSDLIIDIGATILYQSNDISENIISEYDYEETELSREISENNNTTDISDNFNTGIIFNNQNIYNISQQQQQRQNRGIIYIFKLFSTIIIIIIILYIILFMFYN